MKSNFAASQLLKIIFFLLIPGMLFFASCNKDGIGIYYQISQEEKQANSNISELEIQQVVEVGTDIYARSGLSVWKQSGNDWAKISGSNYVYGIVPFGGTLYGSINNEVNSLSDGQIRPFDGTSWGTEVFSYSGAINLFQIEHASAYLLVLGSGGVDEVQYTGDFSTFSTQTGTVNFLDGADLGGTYYGISSDTIYSGVMSGTPAAVTPTFDTDASGDYRALVTDSEATENIYLTTSTGQLYSSTDGTNWTLIVDDIEGDPVNGSMDIVDVGGTDYLIIGTDSCYYEMEIGGGGSVVGPTATADTAGPYEFAAKYPELSIALVYDVYTAPSDGTLYLATQFGLYKRLSDGEFERQ